MGQTSIVISFIGVLSLALLHLMAGRLHRGAEERPTWLSAASGMAIAYVFVHLLPELAEEQTKWLDAREHRELWWLNSQVYLATLVGVILSLAVDRRAQRRRAHGYWFVLISFAIYNALLGGFALQLKNVVEMFVALIAFGAHFLLNDHRLHTHYGKQYEVPGRWILAGSILFGWLFALVWRPPVVVTAAILGILSGGIVLNIIKEELPERDSNRFSLWVIGALGYAALLLILRYIEAV